MITAHSLKNQLRLWMLIPMLVVLTLSGMVSYNRALRFANLAYDRALYRTVLALSDEIAVDDASNVSLNLPDVAKNLLKYDDSDDIYLRIVDPKGQLVLGDPKLRLPAKLPTANQHTYFDFLLNGEKIRGVAFALPMSEQASDGNIIVAMAETTSKRDAMVAEIVEEMLLPQILIMLLASVMIEISIRYALKPLQAMTDALHQRSHRDLTPIEPAKLLSELQPLFEAMNALLYRVRASIQQQQQFIADASHQMRTPIAGLQTQAELAMREASNPEQQEALSMMVQSTSRLSHLIQRLLSLAKADSAVTEHTPLDPVHLKNVIEEVCNRFISLALQKQLELSVEITTQDDCIEGDALMLTEMLSNLVDNAIHYTPPQGLIVLRLFGDETTLNLQVADSGIGIPSAEYADIFKRFHRINPNQGDGCGLGLAIVAEVAEQHFANISVAPGLPHPSQHTIGSQFTIQFRRHETLSPQPRTPSAI